ncbi:MAG: hypothetical protein LJF30_23675 [Acidobacteria bacterium]|nr:hypothetical protein [Acidobacteriota bacterium]
MVQSPSKMIRVLVVTAAALSLAVGAAAQATHTTETVPGTAKVTKLQLKGEVVYVEGDYLIAEMIPSGDYVLFHMKPGKTGMIDGVEMPLSEAEPGTVLTADVVITEAPVVDRTTTTLKGTVFYASPNSVILTLENGENRQYEVPEGLKFDVDGKMLDAMELRQGMKLTATKIVESPRVVMSEDTTVTGTAPK